MASKEISYIPRYFDPLRVLKQRSAFLLGPRQTGKSSLLKQRLSSIPTYNLLDSDVYLKLSRQPSRLRQEIKSNEKIVAIDEIQKLPALLDEVHFLIEERQLRFLLTGSSARKLRKGGVNLLGGRAAMKHLHPFILQELGDKFDLQKALNIGLLPSVYFSETPEEALESYVGLYLKEEIAAEGLTRNIPAFGRFLEVAGLSSGHLVNFTKIANDAQVARTTVQEYFQILKDTLIGQDVPAWRRSRKRKPISTSKFYLFDPGVTRFLQNRSAVRPGSPEFGELFEGYIYHELTSYRDYSDGPPLSYWRSLSGFEVDFILGDSTAIEVKASKNIGPRDLKGLTALQEEKQFKHLLVVSLEETERRIGQTRILPWRLFLEELWQGKLI